MIEIKGLNEAYNCMSSLTSLQKQKVIRTILKKAADKNIKGPLKSHNQFSPSKSRKGTPFTTVMDKNNSLGVLSGVSGKFFHYRFIEFGTKERFTKPYKNKTSFFLGYKRKTKVAKKMAYRGLMRKSPFIVKTIDDNLPNVLNYFVGEYQTETKKIMDRLAKKK